MRTSCDYTYNPRFIPVNSSSAVKYVASGVTGKRYEVKDSSKCFVINKVKMPNDKNTNEVGTIELPFRNYFPGNIDGTCEETTYSVYKIQ